MKTIKVLKEISSQDIDDSQADVKEAIDKGFKELLDNKSNVIHVVFKNSSDEYIIYPVPDDIKKAITEELNKF